ncbi:hypothetical protein UFOVP453_27 [uncultured Caudovirales phage]|uniref:Uncharacterized protein n=1 Tax=uncultured Caudovirales phage TaxID=2100421 RepID=A0A6J5MGQ7_9CAUD|nr:hypothetical protein UFOVP453_27 [uncultured Caudovirales phage]
MSEKIEIRTRTHVVEIDPNCLAINPRYDDNLGKMIAFHSRYTIGDEHNETPESLNVIIERTDVVSLPIYAYIHGGVTISNMPYSCRFDSGQIGYIYATHDDIMKWYGVKELTPNLIDCVRDKFIDEIHDYDYFMNGTFYRIVVNKKNYDAERNEIEMNFVHACGGFTEIRDAIDEAIAYVDDETATAIRSHFNITLDA